MKKNLEGLVHIYFGSGKGKTTAAIGLGVRASLSGYKVCMIQFMKGQKSAEETINSYITNFEIYKYGKKSLVTTPEKKDKDLVKKALKHAKKTLQNYDMVILDEINYAVGLNLLNENDVIKIIKSKPKNLELVLTGGITIPRNILNLADYVSEINQVKHPYQKGIKARKGIEY